MTRKLNNDNGLQDRKTEHQAVTGGIFYCRDSAGFSVSAFVNRNKKCSDFGKKNYSGNGNSLCSNFGNNSAVTVVLN